MGLTVGYGPFGERSGGTFNFEVGAPEGHVLYLEDTPRRVRVMFGGETVADSRRVRLLHETKYLPVYYFPEEDVRMDLMEESDHTTRCPFKGDAAYWSVRAGDRVAENAAWGYPEPLRGCPPISGLLAFYWDRMDAWYEEEEEVFVHPRDPYHRVDILDSSRHVRVLVNGEAVAETNRPKVLFETALPPRYYIPQEDVRTEHLTPTGSRSRCPYKGIASYWALDVGGERVEDIVWSYPEPIAASEKIRDHLCFYNERVDIEVDGALEQRPRTQWF